MTKASIKTPLSFGAKCMRFMLIVDTTISLVVGIICIGFGGFVYYKINGGIVVTSVHALPIFILVFGVLLFFISAFGFLGAIFINKYVLRMFVFLLIGVILIEIVAAVISIACRDMTSETFSKFFIDTIHLWESAKSDAVLRTLRGIQDWLQCCGGNKSADWKGNQIKFCCNNGAAECLADADQYHGGCGVRFREKVGAEAAGIGIALLIICLTEIISAFFAFKLSKSSKSQ